MNDQTKPVPEHIDIELSRPITVNGTEVKALRMREPLVSDQLVVTKTAHTPEDQQVLMFANLCGVMPVDLHKLTVRDMKRLEKAYEAFTVEGED